MILGYVYKLKPSKEQSKKMDSWLDMLRASYNYNLADRIDTYQSRFIQGEYCDLKTKAEICPLTCHVGTASGYPWKIKGARKGNPIPARRNAGEIQSAELPSLKLSRPWYKNIDATVLQHNIERLDNAYQKFFEGNGFPRFQNRSTFRSFTYKTGVEISGSKIRFPKIGEMEFFNSRSIPEGFRIKSVTLRKKANGWFVSVRIEDKEIPMFPIMNVDEVESVVGCDVGIRKLVTLSDNKRIENPKFATNKKTRKFMRSRQRRVSRKKKGSKNRRKAANIVARLYQRIVNKRTAFQWKIAIELAKKYDAIFMEDLKVSNMKKRCKPKKDEQTGRYINNGQSRKVGLNRAISDASWYELKLKIKYAAAKSGKIFDVVPAKHSSQECPECHHIDSLNRNGEIFICTDCGFFADADNVGGLNIKQRGAKMLGIALKCRVKLKKVRVDYSETKQLSLFETLTAESTVGKRRQHRAEGSKRGVPGNLPTQLCLWDISDLA